jgi:3-oxo-5-alpha-steroid 4-dehydrogenase 1
MFPQFPIMFLDYPNQDSINLNIQIGFIVFDIITFIILFFITAHYGRHTSNTGKLIIVSDKFAWIIEEIPTLIISVYYTSDYISSAEKINYLKFLMIAFYYIHYFHRSIIYPFKLFSKGRKLPIDIALMGSTFNFFNATMINRSIFYFSDYTLENLMSPIFGLGCLLYGIGMYINIYHDYYILREKKRLNGAYFIPEEFLFKYICSPNYFGEIIEWIGFALATRTVSGLVFSISTFSNLFPRAISHKRWYQEKFKEFPKNRRAIVPFLV